MLRDRNVACWFSTRVVHAQGNQSRDLAQVLPWIVEGQQRIGGLSLRSAQLWALFTVRQAKLEQVAKLAFETWHGGEAR